MPLWYPRNYWYVLLGVRFYYNTNPNQICSSQWTTSQQEEVLQIARTIIPDIKTIAIPPGLNATKGGEAVVEFLREQVLKLGFPTRN